MFENENELYMFYKLFKVLVLQFDVSSYEVIPLDMNRARQARSFDNNCSACKFKATKNDSCR
jgi:hypothetical protein